MIYNENEMLGPNMFADLIPNGGASYTATASYTPTPAPSSSANEFRIIDKYVKKGVQNALNHAKKTGVYIPPVGSDGATPVYVPLPSGITLDPRFTPPPVSAPAPVMAPPPVIAPPPPVTAAPAPAPPPVAAPAPTPGADAPPPLPAVTQIVRDTPGYQFQVQEGLDAINANAYARGLGNSGATFKALQEYGRNKADQYYQQYLSNVAAVAEQGRGAAGAVSGAGNQMGAGVAGALSNQAQAQQNAANAAANAAYMKANATNSMAGSVAGALGTIGGAISSYR